MPAPRPSGLPCRHATPGAPICAACARNRARVKAWADARPGRVSARAVRWARRHKRKRRAIWRAYRVNHAAAVSTYQRGRAAVARGAVYVEAVSIEAVYRRDRGTCRLCGFPVPEPWAPVADDAARPTLDHILPASHGGSHSYANVRLAHKGCNARRGAPLPPDDSDPIPF